MKTVQKFGVEKSSKIPLIMECVFEQLLPFFPPNEDLNFFIYLKLRETGYFPDEIIKNRSLCATPSLPNEAGVILETIMPMKTRLGMNN